VVPDELTGGPHFAAFCRHYIVHTRGRWARQPLVFEEWQREFWWEALEIDPVTGLRVYQEVGKVVPTKNGKSTEAAACAHYMLTADGENEPEVIVGAATRKQAGVVLGHAKSMARRSPRLRAHLRVLENSIRCPANDGVMYAVAADGPMQHGVGPSCNIIDEIHAHRNATLYTALAKSTSARDQPFTFWITTGGPEGGLLGDLLEQMVGGPGETELRNGGTLRIYRDRTNGVLIWCYAVPDGADIADPRIWKLVNPASWRTVDVLSREYQRLKARGALVDWRMYHLNQLALGGGQPWMPADDWQACAGNPVFRRELRTYAAVRIDHDHRAAAVAIAQRQGERMALRVRTFPETALPGDEYLPLAEVEEHVRTLQRRYPARVSAAHRPGTATREYQRPMPGPEVAYHGSFFEGSAQTLQREGIVLVDVPSSPERLTPAAETLMSLVTSRALVHDGEDELARQMASVVAKPAPKGWSVAAATDARSHEPRRIVAAQAAMIAVQRAMTAPAPPSRVVRYGDFPRR